MIHPIILVERPVMPVLPRSTSAALLILASLFSTSALAADPANVTAGKKVFRYCVACHQVGPSARSAFGPQLNGIVGRKAGSEPNYPYSPAMKTANFVWTEEKLRAFVRAPNKVIPGNSMRFFGLWNDAEAENLIAYLRTLK